jgi:hypothetical protein
MSNKSLFLSREVEVYVNFDSKWWKLPVLDGFSFSQSTNTAEVTVKEMADTSNNSRRGRMMFNNSVSPAEFSFSTYARPVQVNDAQSVARYAAVEDVCWAMMGLATGTSYDDTDNYWNDQHTVQNNTVASENGSTVKFTASNKLTHADAGDVYFHFPENDGGTGGDAGIWYKVTDAVINEASMEFDIDGITTINWSGMGTSLDEVAAPSGYTTREVADSVLNGTTSFIQNRLTQLTLSAADGHINVDGDGNADNYSLVLTGGSITITNNVEYTTPESLGIVNKPLGHTLGNRSVSGSFTCYLDHGSMASADLLQDLLAASSRIKNSFATTFKVGGTTEPRLEVNVPKAHLEIPTHSVEDVISMEISFHGMPSDISSMDEINLTYFGAATS